MNLNVTWNESSILTRGNHVSTYRSLPGEGEFDITRFLNLVYGANIDLPLSVEVISDDLLALPVSESARLMAETTRNVLSLHNQSKE